MRDQKIRRTRFRRLLPITFIAGVIALAFSVAGPANAAESWKNASWTVSTKDADGKSVGVGLRHYCDTCASSILYRAEFDPYGEKLTVRDDRSDGHPAQVTVKVFAQNSGTVIVDVDVFYVGTADTPASFNLGTPDGSGDIAEGRQVSIQICIKDTGICSTTYYGKS